MQADRSDDRRATRTCACPRCRPGPARAGIGLRSTPPQLLLWAGTALLGVRIAILNVLLPSLTKRDFPTRIGPVTGAYTAVQSGVAALAAGVAVPLTGHTSGGWRLPLGIWAGLAVIALWRFRPAVAYPSGSSCC